MLAGGFEDNTHAVDEILQAQADRATAIKIGSPIPSPNGKLVNTTESFDPFSCVEISKPNYVDNQILTSFRTLTK